MDATYVGNILETVMLPYVEEEMPLRLVFQQDNDPKHTSKKAKEWFRSHNMNVLEWPAQSPDLNPIEHVWIDVKQGVRVPKNYGKQQKIHTYIFGSNTRNRARPRTFSKLWSA